MLVHDYKSSRTPASGRAHTFHHGPICKHVNGISVCVCVHVCVESVCLCMITRAHGPQLLAKDVYSIMAQYACT